MADVYKETGGNKRFRDDDVAWTCSICGKTYLNSRKQIEDAKNRHNEAFHSHKKKWYSRGTPPMAPGSNNPEICWGCGSNIRTQPPPPNCENYNDHLHIYLQNPSTPPPITATPNKANDQPPATVVAIAALQEKISSLESQLKTMHGKLVLRQTTPVILVVIILILLGSISYGTLMPSSFLKRATTDITTITDYRNSIQTVIAPQTIVESQTVVSSVTVPANFSTSFYTLSFSSQFLTITVDSGNLSLEETTTQITTTQMTTQTIVTNPIVATVLATFWSTETQFDTDTATITVITASPTIATSTITVTPTTTTVLITTTTTNTTVTVTTTTTRK